MCHVCTCTLYTITKSLQQNIILFRQYCHLGQAQEVQNIIKSLARKTCILTTTAFYNRKNILASHTHCTYVPSGHVYLHELGTAFNPAPSCKDLQPHRTSGWYVIKKYVWPSIRSVLQHGPGGMWEGRRVDESGQFGHDTTQPRMSAWIQDHHCLDYVVDQGLLVVCLSNSPRITFPTTELVDESSPTKIRLLMSSVHTLDSTPTISFTH